jgi:LacI family transcriptional regulator
MLRPVTIADVAREAGVSAGTVSRVLNRRDADIKISKATQTLVIEAAERLGYQPNRFASALRTRQTGVIGAIVRDISDPFLSLMARELQHAARRRGVDLLLSHAENEPGIVRRQLTFMRNWFDGLIILGDMPDDEAIFARLREMSTPFVAVACGTQVNAPLVNIDEALGTTQIMEYLHALGHRRVGFLGNIEHAATRERLASFKAFVQARGLAWHDDYLQATPYSRKAAIASTQRLLSLPQPPTAIVCTADLMALGALSGALQMGWRVPEAVSIISFDDIEEAGDVFPALTTLRQPVGEMAEQAIRLLLRLIEDPAQAISDSRILVQPHLMIRRSCSPAIG